jgi:hypothetical protein
LLFSLMPEEVRPDWRWLLVGPPGTGSGWHVDPLGSAWNGIMSGAKRWAVAAPGVMPPPAACTQTLPPPPRVAAPAGATAVTRAAAPLAQWFAEDWANWRRAASTARDGGVAEGGGEGEGEGKGGAGNGQPLWYEFVQQEGEVVYLPQGWGHAAINLGAGAEPTGGGALTVAVTHNFVTSRDFRECWRQVRERHPVLADQWRAAARQARPELLAHMT